VCKDNTGRLLYILHIEYKKWLDGLWLSTVSQATGPWHVYGRPSMKILGRYCEFVWIISRRPCSLEQTLTSSLSSYINCYLLCVISNTSGVAQFCWAGLRKSYFHPKGIKLEMEVLLQSKILFITDFNIQVHLGSPFLYCDWTCYKKNINVWITSPWNSLQFLYWNQSTIWASALYIRYFNFGIILSNLKETSESIISRWKRKHCI